MGNCSCKETSQATQFIEASKHGRAALIDQLIKEGIDVNTIDREGKSALYYAAGDNHVEIVRMLIAAGVDKEMGSEHHTPLMYAAVRGNYEVVHTLLEAGANIEARSCGQTALSATVQYGMAAQVEVLKVLLYYGADKDSRSTPAHVPSEYYVMPIHLAAQVGQADLVRLLLMAGVDIECRRELPEGRWTALMIAAYEGHPRVVRELLRWGADREAKDERGRTAHDIAAALCAKNQTAILEAFSESA